MQRNTRHLTLNGESIEYTVTESSEATEPRIDVGIHDVTVVVPDNVSVDPEELLEQHAGWVLEKKAKYDAYYDEAPDRRFEEGEEFPYLGESYELIVERRSSSTIDQEYIRLANHHVDQTSIKRALEQFYRREARALFEELADQFATKMGVEFDRLEIRNQRTKWGSCSSSGTISLNWRLLMAPKDVIEYVVIHEVAHLREANHTDAFWHLVSEYDPDYLAHSEWLDEHSTQLIFSKEDL